MNYRIVITFAFSFLLLNQAAQASGLADRRAEAWASTTGLHHIHSSQMAGQGSVGGTDGLADKKAHEKDAAGIIRHIHEIHGPTAAGMRMEHAPHTHRMHRHTVKSNWVELPKGFTAHQKKRLMFDHQ